MSLPKGFVSLGVEDSMINTSVINENRCFFDKQIGKVAIIDKYGGRFNVDPKLCKGKFRWKE